MGGDLPKPATPDGDPQPMPSVIEFLEAKTGDAALLLAEGAVAALLESEQRSRAMVENQLHPTMAYRRLDRHGDARAWFERGDARALVGVE